MTRLLIALCLQALAWAAQASPAASPAAYDGLGNTYVVAIDAQATRARVQASLWLPSPSLAMFGVQSSAKLPDGQAELIHGLAVADAGGRPLAVRDLGEGDFEVAQTGRVKVSYDIALEHDRHSWPAGLEEVSFHTDEGLMATGYSLLLAPGDAMTGPIDIRFELPPGWKAHTPWQETSANQFQVPTRRELLNNALFFGTSPAQTLDVGGVQLTFVLGKRFRAATPLFVELLEKQMRSYRETFGGPPLASRYLVLVNEGLDDGGAFASSFSQFIGEDATEENRIGWGFVMSHELLHFWNGLSLVPADPREEWFKEGITDYLTVVTQARNGLLDEAQLYWRLENITRRYLIARVGQGLAMSVREAGANKQPNRELIYGGGALTGMALDIELRKASHGRVGLPRLLASLYAEFGEAGKTYSLADVERHARELTDKDFREFFAGAVESTSYFDARPMLAEVGLKLNTYLYDESFVRADPAATAEQRARFRQIFGQPAVGR